MLSSRIIECMRARTCVLDDKIEVADGLASLVGCKVGKDVLDLANRLFDVYSFCKEWIMCNSLFEKVDSS